ncbi:hypothetical protein LVD17_11825 [Fulvivirga ulvae]|uniref:hypothetical protein n=1 Tax=Fulvivirga ulvae TaxID=2904245 RepID=UPI001F3A984C|nr:hypothetical protein [Fulvivirga ulvae]UII34498.1 hypothetical protein LVD17_11825 [Fulvivirga ulvae]
MRRILIVAAISFMGIATYAQDYYYERDTIYEEVTVSEFKRQRDEVRTLSGGGGYHSGGFGAVSFKSSEFQDKILVMGGFRAGWIINRTLAIGFEGYGVIPTAEFDNIVPGRNAVLLGGYGGMFLEPIIFSNQVVHVTFPLAGGAGWLGLHDDWEEDYDRDEEIIDEDVFWYVEPGVALELNVSRHFRINCGISKRFTEDLKLLASDANEFEKLNYFLTLKFGKF